MKKTIYFLVAALACIPLMYTIGQSTISRNAQNNTSVLQKQRPVSPKEERREAREKRRAERIAAYEKFMDSVVMSRHFQFNPQTMQVQPAGAMRQIMNPNFEIGVWGDVVDVCIPYIKGYVPPYSLTMLNYTLPSVQGYMAEQTHEGWTVTFSSPLFTAGTYTFTFEIYSRMGGCTLTVTNPWYNPVQYTGTITAIY
ncbi:MAG: DUF4251 domain-containing protein [Alistipes sp.]|nr:DUF4251 domain-containing protein [Alistipes sp.]